MTNQLLEQLRFSSNGVKDGLAMTSSIDEAYTQQIALITHLKNIYLLIHLKLVKMIFLHFVTLKN